MPYTPPNARAAFVSHVDIAHSSSEPCIPAGYQQQYETVHESRTDLPATPSSRTSRCIHRGRLPISMPRSSSVALSTPDTLDFAINNLGGNDTGSKALASQYSRYSSNNHYFFSMKTASPSPTKNVASSTTIASPPSSTDVSPHSSIEITPPLSADISPPSSTEMSPLFYPPTSPNNEISTAPTTIRGRLREKPDLVQLQAVSAIFEQHRLDLPDKHRSSKTKLNGASVALLPPRKNSTNTEVTSEPRLSSSGPIRKILQSGSYAPTDALPGFPRMKVNSRARSASENQRSDSKDEVPRKPTLIRKQSGELVRPALRASCRRATDSIIPRIPASPKAVHFQTHDMEHIRLFQRGERSIAAGADSSFSASQGNYIDLGLEDEASDSRLFPYRWEIQLNDIPQQSSERTRLQVRLERIYLSSDTKVLIGIVAVNNLAFYKLVTARFTLDHWKTTNEVVAEFDYGVSQTQVKDGCDRFVFHIMLENQTHLEDKTMSLCIRYNVNAQEFWTTIVRSIIKSFSRNVTSSNLVSSGRVEVAFNVCDW